VPPFAVVASNTTDPAVGPYWPVRRYNWGTCEAFRSRDSDFTCLKQLVLELSYWDIRDSTEKRYKAYRRQRREAEAVRGQSCRDEAGSSAVGAVVRGWAHKARAALATAFSEGAAITTQEGGGDGGSPSSAPSLSLLLLPLIATVAALLSMLLASAVGPSPSSPDDTLHLLADLREREHYIAQLQGEASFLLDALTGDSGGALPAGCAEVVSSDVQPAAKKFRSTINQFVYGDVCYDEEYNAGVPWAVQLLISGCVVFAVWSASRHSALDALPQPGARLAARASLYGVGLLCLYHLQRAFSRAL